MKYREYTLYPGGITFPTAADARAALVAELARYPSAYVVTPSGKRLKVRRPRKRKNPSKKQRKAAAHRRSVVRRKAKAAAGMLKAMNPASKVRAVRVKRLKGGGVSIIPVKVKVLRRGR